MSALNNVISRSFPGVNLLVVSLVEDLEPKEYSNKYYCFVKCAPAVKSNTSPTGKTYDMKSAITFKMEAEKILSMAFALKCYANGKGAAYDQTFGSYELFADTSKSQYNSGVGKKSCKIMMGVNNKTNKSIINVFFSSEGNKAFGLYLSPYEAYAMSEVFEMLGKKCIELELSSGGIVVKKPQKSNFNQQNTQSPIMPPNNYIKTSENVINDFAGFFNPESSNNPFED